MKLDPINDNAEPEEIMDYNMQLLDIFANDLDNSKLSYKIKKRHYLNAFSFADTLAYGENLTVLDGVYSIDWFFMFHFPNNCNIKHPEIVKDVSLSIKKFYKSMYDHKLISKRDYDSVKNEIKENLNKWIYHYYEHLEKMKDFFF